MSSAGGMMTAATKEHPVGTGNVEVVMGKGKYRANEHPVECEEGTHANGYPVGLTGDEEDFAKKEHPVESVTGVRSGKDLDMNIPENKVEKIRKIFEVENTKPPCGRQGGEPENVNKI